MVVFVGVRAVVVVHDSVAFFVLLLIVNVFGGGGYSVRRCWIFV